MRSAKEVDVQPSTRPHVVIKKNVVRDVTSGDEGDIKDSCNKSKEPQHAQLTPVCKYQAKIPYPARLKKQKDDTQFKMFSEILKKLHINLLLVETFS